MLRPQSLPAIAVSPSSVMSSVEWTQMLTVIGVGLLIAGVLQFLLVTLGSAIALSCLPIPKFESTEASTTTGAGALPVGFLAGFGVLSTVNIVLFSASFLAVSVISFPHPLSGAIAGMVLWAAYFLLVMWLSLRTLSTWGETFLNISTAGLRRFFSILKTPFQLAPNDSLLTSSQLKAVIQEEVQAAVTTWQQQLDANRPNPNDTSPATYQDAAVHSPEVQAVQTLRQQLQDYLSHATGKNLTPKQLDRTVHEYLEALPETDLPAIVTAIKAEDWVPILTARPDLSDKKKARIIHQIQAIWKTHAHSAASTELEEPESGESAAAPATAHSSKSNALPLPEPAPLKTALDQFNDQILPQLPEVLQHNWATLAPLAATVTQTNLADAIAPLQDVLSSTDFKDQLNQLLDQSQAGMATLNHQIEHQAEQLRDRTSHQLSELQQTIQQGTQTRLNAIRQDAQSRLNATRKTLAIAAWWLFTTTLTGGISATLAGAIAAGFKPLAWVMGNG